MRVSLAAGQICEVDLTTGAIPEVGQHIDVAGVRPPRRDLQRGQRRTIQDHRQCPCVLVVKPAHPEEGSELSQRGSDAFEVVAVAASDDIEVVRESLCPVEPRRYTPDEQIFDVVC